MTAEPAASESHSQDERVTAALAHATTILPGMGLLGSIVIWATQKEKSRYVAFQALQATVYHIVMILAGFLGGVCYMCSIVAFPLTMAVANPTAGDEGALLFLPMMIPFAVLGLVAIFWFAFIVYGMIGAANCLQGRDFRYLVIGRRLERYLQGSRT